MMWWISMALAAPISGASSNVDEAMWMLLSARHAVPCETVTATSPDPVEDLLVVVEQVSMPPWAPMRAADCLIRQHAADVRVVDELQEWVVDPARKGLGRLVMTRIDALDAPMAVDLARRAWAANLDARFVERRLLRSANPDIRAVVTKP
ncbi:MAG: hypothetical protein AAGA48_37410 [Myxococcota bacterium]